MGLIALLRDHRDDLEADFHRFYGLDLCSLWRGELGIRKVSVLVAALPAESATACAVHHMPRGWGVSEFLLSDLFYVYAGKQHPARPNVDTRGAEVASQVSRLQAQRARLGGRNG